ncbi:hypothetical protein PsorP6_011445 [Peronosclerospora sorghi]|uniref:Uncharacterized protein n=1 Tax=Peronosclerospora sorghi TaxID=230839 RepID=A0ACC0WKC2_9STRA|nr:hypothetical protein PsorP6_011445 [Peronosclerospora sorghi]
MVESQLTYSSLDEGVLAASVHAMRNRVTYRVCKRDKKKVVLTCSGEACSASIRIIVSEKTELVTVTVMDDVHGCHGTLQGPRGLLRNHDFLVSLVLENFPVDKDTMPKNIQCLLKMQLDVNIPFSTAHKVKEKIIHESAEDQSLQFQKVQPYIHLLQEADPSTVVKSKTQAINGSNEGRFHSVFIAPGAARQAFKHMRKFVVVDGTFTKNRFVQTLLLAVGRDANDQLVLLAWTVVLNECTDTWTWFMIALMTAYPDMSEADTVIINDRE